MLIIVDIFSLREKLSRNWEKKTKKKQWRLIIRILTRWLPKTRSYR